MMDQSTDPLVNPFTRLLESAHMNPDLEEKVTAIIIISNTSVLIHWLGWRL